MNIKTELLQISAEQLNMLGPIILLLAGSLIVMIAVSFFSKFSRTSALFLSLASLVGSAIYSFSVMDIATSELFFNGMLILDRFSYFFFMVFALAGAITLLISDRYLQQEEMQHPEYPILILFSVLGMMFLVSSVDLISLFIALEIMSLSVYSLVAFRRNDRLSNEAGLKYFILGGASSALFLYGSSLIYGVTGSTRIAELLKYVTASSPSMLFALGGWLLVAGFLFKIASVPFHMWMPDVYEGAPAPVTGFMTSALKAAVFATFIRILMEMGFGKMEWGTFQNAVYHLIWISAVLTMFIGNIAALTQNNLKRVFAYSSIAHTGYLLVGLIAAMKNKEAMGSVILYLISYVIVSLGIFGILTITAKKSDTGLNIHDFSGLSRRKPWLAAVFTVFLFSMAGIPPTAGFIAKYSIFYAAVQNGEIPLVVIGVLCSAISVYYYLRVIVFMYMRNPVEQDATLKPVFAAVLAVLVAALLTLQIGILPEGMINSASRVIAEQF